MAELGTLGVIITLILGTIIFVGVNTIFEIWYFNWTALFGEWFGCCVVAYIIVGFFSGIISGFFSIIWFLIKLIAVIAILGSGIMFIYNKLSGKKQNESKGNE